MKGRIDTLLDGLNALLGRPNQCFANGAWQIGNIHASRYNLLEVSDANGAVRTLWYGSTRKELDDAIRALTLGVTLGQRFLPTLDQSLTGADA